MKRQCLIISHTRMGDLVQTIPLISRLRRQHPEMAIDLLVDQSFVEMARMIPGVRAVLASDVQGLIDHTRAQCTDPISLLEHVRDWLEPLRHTQYDRLLNLTFNRRSGLMSRYLRIPDTRGVTTDEDGTILIKNPWFGYLCDFHHFRPWNRFNLVDLFMLGGAGPGSPERMTLQVPSDPLPESLRFPQTAKRWIGMQIGASDIMKAWRPEAFGQTMAQLSTIPQIGFVLIGTSSEQSAVDQAIRGYREAGGTAPIHTLLGRTTIAQVLQILRRVEVLVTNDTGPMHLAVAVGTPVINLSVGHVDFWETGPYGKGHYVVQPDFPCAPCGFAQHCQHHTCKDQIPADVIRNLVRHRLGLGPFPTDTPTCRIYESEFDADGLITYRQRSGRSQADTAWLGTWWRRFWFEEYVGHPSNIPLEPCPGLPEEDWSILEHARTLIRDMITESQLVIKLSQQTKPTGKSIQTHQQTVDRLLEAFIKTGETGRLTSPIAWTLRRQHHNMEGTNLVRLAQQQTELLQQTARRLGAIKPHQPSTRTAHHTIPVLSTE